MLFDDGGQLAPCVPPRSAFVVHVTSAAPVWLWAPDATCVLWSNAAGAAALGAPTPAVLATRAFSGREPMAMQVARIAGTLPSSGAPRLERLRGVATGIGRFAVCACSRFVFEDGMSAVLVVATEPAGPVPPLAERVRRQLAGCDFPLAIFSPEGALIHAAPAMSVRLGTITSLAELGA